MNPFRNRDLSGLARAQRPLLRALPALLAAAPALAQEQEPPPYLDDRSDPAAIVRSYYNAVNRQEHARAWSYYGEPKPGDYPSFAAGYALTTAVSLALGEVTTEGAAGSIYGSVPLAIEATTADGETRVYAGCVTTRQLQPAVQEPPFRPLEIVGARLEPAEGPLDAAVPADCDA